MNYHRSSGLRNARFHFSREWSSIEFYLVLFMVLYWFSILCPHNISRINKYWQLSWICRQISGAEKVSNISGNINRIEKTKNTCLTFFEKLLNEIKRDPPPPTMFKPHLNKSRRVRDFLKGYLMSLELPPPLPPHTHSFGCERETTLKRSPHSNSSPDPHPRGWKGGIEFGFI